MKLGIIGAMTIEVDTLKSQLQDLQIENIAGMEFYQGILCGESCVVVQCGVGKVNAAMCAQILCTAFGVTHIINTGVAGSLNAALDICDFVVSKEAIYHDFDCHSINPNYVCGQVPGLPVRAFPADVVMAQCAMEAVLQAAGKQAQLGTVASGDQCICQHEQKQKIIENTGALCTEMEGAAIAHTAWRNQVPFVILRAISDKADNSAHMDYPAFEVMAAEKCAAVVQVFIEKIRARV